MTQIAKINLLLILLIISLGINIYSISVLKKSYNTVNFIRNELDTIQNNLIESEWSFCNNNGRRMVHLHNAETLKTFS